MVKLFCLHVQRLCIHAALQTVYGLVLTVNLNLKLLLAMPVLKVCQNKSCYAIKKLENHYYYKYTTIPQTLDTFLTYSCY